MSGVLRTAPQTRPPPRPPTTFLSRVSQTRTAPPMLCVWPLPLGTSSGFIRPAGHTGRLLLFGPEGVSCYEDVSLFAHLASCSQACGCSWSEALRAELGAPVDSSSPGGCLHFSGVNRLRRGHRGAPGNCPAALRSGRPFCTHVAGRASSPCPLGGVWGMGYSQAAALQGACDALAPSLRSADAAHRVLPAPAHTSFCKVCLLKPSAPLRGSSPFCR